ncbi:carbamoyltransferase [Alphaproteobacteria bacterium]|nr:carbamoyltransferase [Alphaproteobacteria bacterium]
MRVILGLNLNHADTSACLLVDGLLVGAVAEERLGKRIKHSSEFPINAIKHLLNDNGVSLKDVDFVAIARNPRANIVAKVIWSCLNLRSSVPAYLESMRRSGSTLHSISKLYEYLEVPKSFQTFKVIGVEHHLAHIASSYFTSGFDSRVVGFSYDASGDFVSAMLAHCEGLEIKVKKRVFLPHSLGFFYTAICQFIGFDKFGEEYKVMGLAPYGEDAYSKEMSALMKPRSGFGFELNERYFNMHSGGQSGGQGPDGTQQLETLYTDSLLSLLGPKCNRNDWSQRQKDLAKSAQVQFENVVLHCVNKGMQSSGFKNLVTAGGAALNGVANAKILKECDVKSAFIHPAAGDDGTAVGAAFYVWHSVLKNEKRFELSHASLGPKHSVSTIRNELNQLRLDFVEFESDECLIEEVVSLLADDKVVGWYQGRGEWGPRALGNRSILANPKCPEMKSIINAKIKKRESFRPFAPSVLEEDVNKYFEQSIMSPFMMHVVKFKSNYRHAFPAVTHVDGTGRIQSVNKANNPKYYQLISKFRDVTGTGMLLNTSFNENEPVVDTPGQALSCFMRTDMDAICLENFLVVKSR